MLMAVALSHFIKEATRECELWLRTLGSPAREALGMETDQELFAKGLATYQKVVAQNYMAHREVYGLLHDMLVSEAQQQFVFLDIACGTATWSARALQGTSVTRYIGVDISLLPEANAVAVSQAVHDKMEELKKSFPDGLEYLVPYDTTKFVKAAISEVWKTLIEAGILENDTVIIRKQDTAETGEIVVALIDDEEATLKRLRKRGASIALEAANPAYETRIFGPDRVRVQGKMVSLLRRY